MTKNTHFSFAQWICWKLNTITILLLLWGLLKRSMNCKMLLLTGCRVNLRSAVFTNQCLVSPVIDDVITGTAPSHKSDLRLQYFLDQVRWQEVDCFSCVHSITVEFSGSRDGLSGAGRGGRSWKRKANRMENIGYGIIYGNLEIQLSNTSNKVKCINYFRKIWSWNSEFFTNAQLTFSPRVRKTVSLQLWCLLPSPS